MPRALCSRDRPRRQGVAEWSQLARRIRVPVGFLLALLYVWLARPTWQFLALGAMLIVPGLLIRALASGHVRKNEALATSGPYAYTRNPLYFGSLLIGMGFAMAARSWWIGAMVVLMFCVIYVPVIRSEEEFLRDKFPQFDEYARQVPRMVPRLRPAPLAEAGGGFSMQLYRQHREWNALLGSLLLLGVLILKLTLLG